MIEVKFLENEEKRKESNPPFSFQLPSCPPFLDIDLTNICNARCNFCSVSATRGRNHGELSGKEWLKFFASFREQPLFRVGLLGGEPLLVPEIFEIIAELGNQSVDTRLSTNGYLLNQDTVDKLAASGLEVLQVSLDAPIDTHHDSSRGVKGLFKRATKGLLLAKKAGLKCVINFIAKKSSLQYVEGMILLSEELGVPLSISEFKPVGEGKNSMAEAISIEDFARLKNMVHKRANIAPFFISGKSDGYCNVGLDRVYITEKGAVYPCDLFRDYMPAMLGNIRNESIKEIWLQSPYLNGIRRRQMDRETNSTCGGCTTLDTCRAGCHALSAIHKGAPFLGDPRCFYEK